MPLVLSVVVGYLRLPLLEDLDLEAALARPLLSEVLVKLLHTLVLESLTLGHAFGVVDRLLLDQPLHRDLQSLLKDLHGPLHGEHQGWHKAVKALWVFWRAHPGFLQVVVLNDDWLFLLLYLLFLFGRFAFSALSLAGVASLELRFRALVRRHLRSLSCRCGLCSFRGCSSGLLVLLLLSRGWGQECPSNVPHRPLDEVLLAHL